MKKWKSSTIAKIAAWILLTLSALCCVVSAVAIAVMTSENVYQNTMEETKKEMFSEVSNRYALLAAYNYHQGGKTANEKVFANTSFRYGIIEGYSLAGLDFNDENTYLERNFSEEVTEEELAFYPISISDNTGMVYRNGILTGEAYLYNIGNNQESYYADKICYNSDTGILYYKTMADEYFPVQSVEIIYQGNSYAFSYFFDKEQYQPAGDAETGEVTETVSAAAGDLEKSASAADSENTATTENENKWQKVLEKMLAKEEFNFHMLEEEGFSRETWGTLRLDGIRYIDAADLTALELLEGETLNITQSRDYYLDSNYSLKVNYDNNAKEYVVVSIIPEQVDTSLSKDMFVQADMLVKLLYGWRYPVFAVCLLSAVLAIASFLFLLSAAGHRKRTEAIVPLFPDKIWLDAACFLWCMAEGILLLLMNYISPHLPDSPYIEMFLFAGLCMAWLFLWFILSIAVRIKLGKWWQNTLIYKVSAPVGRFLRMIWQNIDFLWKWILAMLLLAFLEFAGIVTLHWDVESLLLLWFLEKVLIYAAVICGLVQMKQLKEGGEKIAAGDMQYKVNTNWMMMDFRRHGDNLNSISEGMGRAVDERMKSERFKTELITNVSHDIKTPLTSIINYVDLLEKEELNNAAAKEYLEVLERQSGRLKKLIEDLMEASKASTGNLTVHLERLEAGVFMVQTVGEFEEKTKAAELDLQMSKPEGAVYIMADGRHFWRVIDNLMNNICKYAQPQTRVYINMEETENRVRITFRNTSKYPLNISSEELMERFVRGDSSRNTEGSGLGLSIANSLMDIMGGSFRLYVDGDLFKVVLEFEKL